jgi:hypothetical protein
MQQSLVIEGIEAALTKGSWDAIPPVPASLIENWIEQWSFNDRILIFLRFFAAK